MVLGLHQAHAAVFLPQLGLFDLAGGVAGHVGKDDLPGPLIPGQVGAELVDLALGAGHAVLYLNDGRGDLAQALVRQTDDGHIVDLGVGGQEVLDLDGVEVLTAGDDDVLLPVYQEVETVLILLGHIAGVEPFPVEHRGGGLGVVVSYAGSICAGGK